MPLPALQIQCDRDCCSTAASAPNAAASVAPLASTIHPASTENSMVQVGEEVACLRLVDGGANLKMAVVIEGQDEEDGGKSLLPCSPQRRRRNSSFVCNVTDAYTKERVDGIE
ncbi:unnamed protein product [Linum trigynum]|uniref:Uncharacterized protein n=1 Tax=Linum trigynum TaxID=586398 RepID=A0AAV2CJH0_9ROSI